MNNTNNKHKTTTQPCFSLKSRAGFTLAEMTVYIAIFIVSATLIVGIFFTFAEIYQRQTSMKEVNEQLSFINHTIQQLTRESSLIDIPSGEPTDTIILRMIDDERSTVLIYHDEDNQRIMLQEGDDDPIPVTDSNVLVSHFQATKYEHPGAHDTLQVAITMDYNSQNPRERFKRSVTLGMSRISAATFDSHNLPNVDNTFDLGNAVQRWRDLFLSGDIVVGGNAFVNGSVGIGTTNLTSPSGFNKVVRLQGSPHASYVVSTGTDHAEFGVSSVGGWLSTDTNIPFRFVTNGSEKMRILANGNIGIGTDSPNSNLHIQQERDSDDITMLRLTTTGTGDIEDKLNILFQQPATGGALRDVAQISAIHNHPANNRGSLAFFTSITGSLDEAMRINSDGNVGIGTTDPQERLHVLGTGNNEFLAIETTGGNYPGVQFRNDGNIEWIVGTRIADNSNFYFSPDPAGTTGGNFASAAVMTIEKGGNVGIGTTNPLGDLHLGGVGSSPNLYLGGRTNTSGQDGMRIHYNSSSGLRAGVIDVQGESLRFRINDSSEGHTERMRIASDGRVGIGTDSPGSIVGPETLSIRQIDGGNNNGGILMDTGSRFAVLGASNNDDGRLVVRVGVSSSGSMSGGVKLTRGSSSWEAYSDISLKQNLRTIDSALEKIRQINGYYFDWKDEEHGDTQRTHVGLIAQELEKVLPEAVSTDEDGIKHIRYTETIPLLLQAIKEQQGIIDENTETMNAFKAETCERDPTFSWCS